MNCVTRRFRIQQSSSPPEDWRSQRPLAPGRDKRLRKSNLMLIAAYVVLLWAATGFAQTLEAVTTAALPQPAAGCPFFFLPQRFPASGQTSSFAVGDDGEIRAGAQLKYHDNGDGTVTDQNTLLMWEKKDQAGGLHDWNNAYPWLGACSNSSTTVCGSEADCSQDGKCEVKGGGITIFQWVAELDTTPCFARHCDWRLPNVRELQSIVDYEIYSPALDAAFNNNCTSGCTVDGTGKTIECSCTQSAGKSQGYYWSGSTYAPSPIVMPPGSLLAWGVLFGDGDVLSAGKTDHDYVRAVRCGFVR
jgi:hypothetical protein